MTTCEAMELLHGYDGEDREVILAEMPHAGPFVVDVWPGIVTASARLVGWLEDCEDVDDLREAFAHFQSCVGADVFTEQQMTAELDQVMQEWVEHTVALAEVMSR